MKRILVLLLAVAALPARAQELSSATLAKVKDGTAYVRYESAGTVHMGTAFVFRKSGDTAWLLTCEHVVSGADKVTVIFQAGLPGEKSLEAVVTGKDSARDVACLRVKDSSLPAPLELSTKTEIRETENVFVAGFPFGEQLATSDKAPNISISKSSVSSLRRGTKNEVVVIQLDGNVNSGNSGGPVVDAKGRVIGVAAAKVSGTNTAFAIPLEEVRSALRGRIRSVKVAPLSCDGARLRLEITAQFEDPVGMAKSVGFCWARTADVMPIKDDGDPDVVTKASQKFKDVPLKIEEGGFQAKSIIEVVRGATDPEHVAITWQACFVPSEGPPVWEEHRTEVVSFKPLAAPPPGKPGDKPADDSPPAGTAIRPPDTLTEIGEVLLYATVGDMVLSRDGASLFVLDLSDCKLLKVNTETMALEASLALMDAPVCMALQHKTDTLWIAARTKEMAPGSQDLGKGRLTAVNPTTMQAGVTMEIPVDPFDLDVSASGIAYVSTVAGSVLVVDTAKKSSEKNQMSHDYLRLQLHPDGSRLYGGSGSSGGAFVCMTTTRELQGKYPPYPSYFWPGAGSFTEGGDFLISPDGRYLIGARGTVVRLSKGGRETDLQPVAKVDPWCSASASMFSPTFVLATREGFLKFVNIGSFELVKSVPAGGLCTHLALDPAKSRLYAHRAKPSGGWQSRADTVPGLKSRIPGHLVAWSLK